MNKTNKKKYKITSSASELNDEIFTNWLNSSVGKPRESTLGETPFYLIRRASRRGRAPINIETFQELIDSDLFDEED